VKFENLIYCFGKKTLSTYNKADKRPVREELPTSLSPEGNIINKKQQLYTSHLGTVVCLALFSCI